jgi:hypothetical protein
MKLRPFYVLLAGCCIGIFLIIFFALKHIGARYDQGLVNLIPTRSEGPAVRKARTIRKVVIFDEDNKGCMEITPDGVVRTYEVCGENLKDANRIADPKFILKLIQIASQIDFSKYRQKVSGPYLTLIIETDTGTEIIYVPLGREGGDIINTINLIREELPQPTQTPGPFTQTPTPTLGGVSNSPTPTPRISHTPGPSPTLNPHPSEIIESPFTCGYTESTGPRPYNISNFICTTQPSPGPTP